MVFSFLFALSRLIPAHAGSTSRVPHEPRQAPAHPRSRGEHVLLPAFMCLLRGSSPLTRGAPSVCHFGPVEPGLIPAHAGSTGGPG